MAHFWSREVLNRRIDRCYLIAAGGRKLEKRQLHLELARYYRQMLASMAPPAQGIPAEGASLVPLADPTL